MLFRLTVDEQPQCVSVDSPKTKARIRIRIGRWFGRQHDKSRFIRPPFDYGVVDKHPKSTCVIPGYPNDLIRWQPLLSRVSSELVVTISCNPARLRTGPKSIASAIDRCETIASDSRCIAAVEDNEADTIEPHETVECCK